MKPRYAFLWANTQSLSTMEWNARAVQEHPNVPWNNVRDFLEVARNNRIQCFHSRGDLKRDVELGKNFLNTSFTKRFLRDIDVACKSHARFFAGLRRKNYSHVADEELYNLFLQCMKHWTTTLSYFRGLQEEGTRKLTETIRKRVSNEEFGIIVLPVALGDVNREQIAWKKLLAHKVGAKQFHQHVQRFPWIASFHFTYKDVQKTLQSRYAFDRHIQHKDILQDKTALRKQQERIFKKHPSVRIFAKRAQTLALARERLKAYWASTDFYLIPLFAEIAKRSGENVADITKYYLTDDVRKLLHGKKLSKIEKQRRKRCFVLQFRNGNPTFVSGRAAELLAREKLGDDLEVTQHGIISGHGAYGGHATGTVRILNANDREKANRLRKTFRHGNILVTQMTQPAIVDIARRAAAIITDEGGLLSHAAIIAREYKIPCVVGTLVATSLFKDGDMVEVDAEKGIVRKLS